MASSQEGRTIEPRYRDELRSHGRHHRRKFGSPVVNRDNEVVGLIFDGNVDSLVLDFAYDDRSARAISVDSCAILEALKSVYRADELAGELFGKR